MVRLRYLMGAGAVVLFIINLAIAGVSHGARNWVEIFGIRFQPSELIKVCLLYTSHPGRAHHLLPAPLR